MQTRNVFFLSFIVAIAAACADADPPVPDRQVKNLGAEARAERQRIARQSLVQPLDETPHSSAGVSITSAADMAAALDIPAGMVTDAQLTSPDAESALALSSFGVIQPRKNKSLVVMSTGRINTNHLPEPGTDFSTSGVEGDAVILRVTVKVPRGANRLSFDYNFLSAESPDYIGSEYNDMFTARVTDAFGSRVVASASVNSSFFFDVSATRAGGTGFDLLFADDPAGTDMFPGDYPPGTPVFPDSGITDFKTANVEVAGGGLVTLEFDIRDLGDGVLDSTVVIDNITFSAVEVIDPNPNLIHPFLGTVKTNPAELAAGGTPVQAVSADGVTQLLLRAKLPGPGQMKFSLIGTGGGVGAVGSAGRSDSVTVNSLQAAPGQYYAFALYTSPEDFDTGGYADAKTRTVSIASQYIPTIGAGFVGQQDITVVRPPVVVVHDIWSSCLYWSGSAAFYKNSLFDVTCADYTATNWKSLDSEENKAVIPDALYEALEEMRGDGVAVTQVDVIAHGTGGLLTRKFVDWPNYRRSSNFNAGDLNRLITMNTPHVGTRMADEVVAMRNHLMGKTDSTSWTQTKNSLGNLPQPIIIDGDAAIDDLKTDSDFINSIGETQVPSHVMMSHGGLGLPRTASHPMLLANVKTLYTHMENKHPLVAGLTSAVKQKLILGPESKLFCDDEHDLFASAVDQKGGVADGAVSAFKLDQTVPDTEHFKVPSDAPHNKKLVDLLNSPIGGGLFAPSIPSPRDVARLNSCLEGIASGSSSPSGDRRTVSSATRGTRHRQPTLTSSLNGTQSLTQGELRIVSPSSGTPVFPGSNVTVVVEASNGFQPTTVFVTGANQAVFVEAPPFRAELSIPVEAIGTVRLVASGIDEQGEMLDSGPVVLPVVSSAKLVSMEVLNGDATLQRPGSTRRLQVLGNYDDGVTRHLSSPGLGTVYASSNTNVATVTSDGTVTGKGSGIATISVRNGTTFTSITVTVGNKSLNHCIEVRLGDYNLFVLEDYIQGHYIDGRVAAGGNIFLQDFSIGSMLPDTDSAQVLVAGGEISLSNGGVWGDVWYGSQFISDASVSLVRGTASHGVPVDFAAHGGALRTLSSELAALPANGTTTLESSWGGILLRGTATNVNVFEVDSQAFTGATLLLIEAPAGSLVVINVRGTSATFSNFGQDLSGGINERGVLFNFPDATSLNASGYGFLGTVLAPKAHVSFNEGSWHGGLYARSVTGNASGHLRQLRDTDICL